MIPAMAETPTETRRAEPAPATAPTVIDDRARGQGDARAAREAGHSATPRSDSGSAAGAAPATRTCSSSPTASRRAQRSRDRCARRPGRTSTPRACADQGARRSTSRPACGGTASSSTTPTSRGLVRLRRIDLLLSSSRDRLPPCFGLPPSLRARGGRARARVPRAGPRDPSRQVRRGRRGAATRPRWSAARRSTRPTGSCGIPCGGPSTWSSCRDRPRLQRPRARGTAMDQAFLIEMIERREAWVGAGRRAGGPRRGARPGRGRDGRDARAAQWPRLDAGDVPRPRRMLVERRYLQRLLDEIDATRSSSDAQRWTTMASEDTPR